MPPRRNPEQSAPTPASPTGQTDGEAAEFDWRAQAGKYLTTAQGLRLPDTDHSPKASDRGPSLLEDFHLREKITHFDHERIPERVVHARGAAAHGRFVANGAGEGVCQADFLREGVETPVFVRIRTLSRRSGKSASKRSSRASPTKPVPPVRNNLRPANRPRRRESGNPDCTSPASTSALSLSIAPHGFPTPVGPVP